MKFKDIKFEIKEVSESGTFVGHAGVFSNVDLGKDIIAPGAFSKTINENPNVPVLWVHGQREPIGVNTQASEDKKGLHVEGRLVMEVQRAREAHALMKAGAVKGLSIGYDPVVVDWSREKEGIRILKELKMWEYSVVPFPMNPEAQITGVKSWGDLEAVVNEFLRDTAKLDAFMSERVEGEKAALIEQAIQRLSALLAAKAPAAAKHDEIAPELLHAASSIEKMLRGEN